MLIQIPQNLPAVRNATVRRWLKKPGQAVKAGEILVELETEDSLLQIQAPSDGALTAVKVEKGQTAAPGAELGTFEPGKLGVPPSGGNGSLASHAPTSASPPKGGTPNAVLMPQAGNTMEEGTLLKWRVKVGDTVAVGQVIAEVETDKATIEIESTEAGKIAWLAAEGSIIPVKQPIATFGDAPLGVPPSGGNGNAAPSTSAPAASSQPTPPEGGTPNLAGVTPILMPQAGNTMEEGTIVKWRVKVGDRVTVGQILCDLETDKATIEMESTDAGRIARIVAPEGAVVPVKQPIALLAEADVDVSSFSAVAAPAKAEAKVEKSVPTVQPTPALAAAAVERKSPDFPIANGGRPKASPAARKFAAERNIDLSTVPVGSGPGGRILSTDLLNVKTGSKPTPAKTAAAPAKEIAPAVPMSNLSGGRKPLSKMRKAIAVNLQTSKQTVPHFYIKQTINADPLFAFYKAQKAATNCTLNDVILLAVGRCLGEFGAFRSRLEGNEVIEAPAANVGIAVSVPDGLVVPVVLNVHALTLAQLAPESKRIVESARNGKIENMGKAVFTISNMGMLGVEDFSAIINPPESGILAISGVREAVIVKDGAMRPGRVMALTLSVDHRVVDGALAAQWMARLKDLLENPEIML
jgi:pyruvate dehydrogenase E2 component (dihydrolipoamide acetyltransferase)